MSVKVLSSGQVQLPASVVSSSGAGNALVPIANGSNGYAWGANLTKAEAEQIAGEAVKKTELPAATAVATGNIASLTGIPAKGETDEVTLVANQIVLLVGQTVKSQNGPWEVKAGAWVRPAGFVSGSEQYGTFEPIVAGKEHAGSVWVMANVGKVTVDTTLLTWSENSAGSGVAKTQKELEEQLHVQSAYAGSSLGVGVNALVALAAASKVEQEKHFNHTALGSGALQHLNGVIEQGKPSAGTAIASQKFHMPSGAVTVNWKTNNIPNITFSEITPGVTGIEKGLPYWIVGAAGTEFELIQAGGYPVTQAQIEEKYGKGENIVTIGGAELKAASTVMILSASCEDNTAIGFEAGRSLTYGGGNTLLGEWAGVELTSGEENTALGLWALMSQKTGNNNTAVGAFAAKENTTGSHLAAFGASALALNIGGSDNAAFGGFGTLAANTGGEKNSAFGSYALNENKTGFGSSAFGQAALQHSTGNENTGLGFAAGTAITTAANCVAVGGHALAKSKTGKKQVALGSYSGYENEGEGNLFLGNEAGKKELGSNKLYISNSETTEPLILGDFSGKTVKVFGTLSATTITLNAEAVAAAALAKEAVTTEKIKLLAVESGQLAAGAVTAAKLGAEAVEAAAIKKETISAAKLVLASVDAPQIKLLAITAALIAKETITGEKLTNATVTTKQLGAPAAKPAKQAEKAVLATALTPCQKVGFTLTGDNALVKFVVKHKLETRLVHVMVQKAAAEEPEEGMLNAAGAGNFTWKPISASEVEITFGTAPTAGLQLFGSVMG